MCTLSRILLLSAYPRNKPLRIPHGIPVPRRAMHMGLFNQDWSWKGSNYRLWGVSVTGHHRHVHTELSSAGLRRIRTNSVMDINTPAVFRNCCVCRCLYVFLNYEVMLTPDLPPHRHQGRSACDRTPTRPLLTSPKAVRRQKATRGLQSWHVDE